MDVKQILKWTGILLGMLIGILLIAVASVYLLTNARMQSTYKIPSVEISVPMGVEAIAYGEHMATIRACNGCHGPNLGGETLIENPMIGYIYPSNLTTGQGGVLGQYSDAQLARAIRHGVGSDDRPLLIMPAHEFSILSDEETGAIIAYLRAQPAVDRELPENRIGPLARILFLAGQLPLIPAELIEHDAPRPPAPQAGVTAEYGAYLAIVCQGCHQPDYAGGPIPGAQPDDPLAPNLTPGGELADWTEADFINTIRTAVKPDGRALDPLMPAAQFSRMTDDELKAIWLFLQSLPAKEQARSRR
jgi:mono/diheme cytochrome c family protein